MRTKKPSGMFPIPVTRALRKLGHDIRDARRRRRIPAEIAAARASISRTTLVKIEKGLTDRLAELADPRNDAVGLQLEEEHLPQRISRPRKQ